MYFAEKVDTAYQFGESKFLARNKFDQSGQPPENGYDYRGAKALAPFAAPDFTETSYLPHEEREMDKQKVIAKLNEALRHEWTGVAQYSQAAFLVTGLWREVYAEMFFESAEESFGHAKKVGDKIVALGGIPSVERNPVKQSHNLEEMLQNALAFEQTAVRVYNEALELAEGDRALVIFLEDILLEEQEGVDHVEKLLREQRQAAGAQDASASKVG